MHPVEPWDAEALRARVWWEQHHADGWPGVVDAALRVPGRAEQVLVSVAGGALGLLVVGWVLSRGVRESRAE